MNERKKRTEYLKTVLIILLSVSAIILVSFSGVISSDVLDAFRPGSGETAEDAVIAHTGSAPMAICVNLGDGLRCGVKYDAQSLQNHYAAFSVVLGEALASAGEPTSVTRENWREAMNDKSVFIDFVYPQPLASLASGLGVHMSSSAAQDFVTRVCLVPAGERLRLLFESDGVYYACDTALRAESLNIPEELAANGAVFAWELDRGSENSDFLILSEMPGIPELSIVNSVSAAMDNDSLLSRVGLNTVIASRYPESDGSSVYVEGERTLRVSLSGNVVYHYYISDDVPSVDVSAAEAVELAWIFAERTVGAHCTSAQLHLSDVFFDESESAWCVEFVYAVNGIAVELAGNAAAARVYIDGESVVAAELTFRSFESGEGLLAPLPDQQAFAAMQAVGRAAQLTYFEGADGSTVQWKMTEEVE